MSENFPLEAGTTRALWDLFGSTGPWQVALEALAEQLPAEDPRVKAFVAKAGAGIMAMVPRTKPCPDLLLVTPAAAAEVSDILAVIEVKTGAYTHWPSQTGAANLDMLPGPVARDIVRYYEDPDRASWTNMCQADVYRSREWWKKKNLIRMEDPEEALWLLFDSEGRTTGAAFSESARSDAWIAIDLKRFAARLRELRPVRALTDSHRDTIAVVLWHIDQAPGTDITVTTSAVPARKASMDDLFAEDRDAPALIQ